MSKPDCYTVHKMVVPTAYPYEIRRNGEFIIRFQTFEKCAMWLKEKHNVTLSRNPVT